MEEGGLSRIDGGTDLVLDELESLEDIPESSLDEFARMAMDVIRPMAKRMLLENLDRSKVGTLTPGDKYQHTGSIRSAVSRAIIGFRRNPGGGYSIFASMPYGMAPFKSSKGGKSDFYTVAASLNYGAVRTKKEVREVVDLPTGRTKLERRSVIGARAKRTVKRYALGKSVSERAINAVEEGRLFSKFNKTPKRGSKDKTIKGFHIGTIKENAASVSLSGGSVVIKPRPFFEFTSHQKEQLSEVFMGVFLESYKKTFGFE